MAGKFSIDYLNAKREQNHSTSGGVNYARRQNLRHAETRRQRDNSLSESEIALAERYAGAAETARILAAELADFRARAGLPAMPVGNATSDVTCCPVCDARRRAGADRVARYRQRKAAAQASAESIPF